jgi:hypothetical protein
VPITAGAIIDALRALPGGAAHLDAATRRGAPIQALRMGPRPLGPAASAPAAAAIPTPPAAFSITLTPPGWTAPGGGVFFEGASILYGTPSLVSSLTQPGLGFQVAKSHAEIVLSVPKDGWYVLAVRSRTGSGYTALVGHGPLVTLRHGAGSPPVVQTWDYRSRPPGEYLYPALLELSGGSHVFWWILEEGQGDFLEFHAEAM